MVGYKLHQYMITRWGSAKTIATEPMFRSENEKQWKEKIKEFLESKAKGKYQRLVVYEDITVWSWAENDEAVEAMNGYIKRPIQVIEGKLPSRFWE